MKAHLLELFAYQDYANKKIMARLSELPEPAEALNLLSHLIHSQNKWLARLSHEPDANTREWFGPAFSLEELPLAWADSLAAWQEYLQGLSEEEIVAEVEYDGPNGIRWAAKRSDLALQLNFHGIHHRAQIQTMFRMQGLQPDFIDYIGIKYRQVLPD
jgi:uncharacterized damage-inducible protein DinB